MKVRTFSQDARYTFGKTTRSMEWVTSCCICFISGGLFLRSRRGNGGKAEFGVMTICWKFTMWIQDQTLAISQGLSQGHEWSGGCGGGLLKRTLFVPWLSFYCSYFLQVWCSVDQSRCPSLPRCHWPHQMQHISNMPTVLVLVEMPCCWGKWKI